LRIIKVLLGIVLGLLVVYLSGPAPDKPILHNVVEESSIPYNELEAYIKAKEGKVDVVEGAEAKIVWADSIPTKTPYVLVYLHGFSASHPEGQPIHENFARRYGCNLFLSRFEGHGLKPYEDPLLDVTPTSILSSAKEAVAIAQQIGDSVIVMGTSTGATLGLYLSSGGNKIHSLITYSANVDMLNKQSNIFKYPWGLQIARLIQGGKNYSYNNDDNPGRKYWTNTYRLEAIQSLRLLVDETMTTETFKLIDQPVFAGYYYKSEQEKDNSISIPALKNMIATISTPPNQTRLINFPEANAHVIGCEFTSGSWEEVQQETFKFAEEVLGLIPVDSSLISFEE
jgi:esterase/lipase